MRSSTAIIPDRTRLIGISGWPGHWDEFCRADYLGPCPPRGNAPQHYVFTLIATSLEAGALPPGLDKAAVLEALKGGKALGAASLVLRFNH